jgi:subtilisin family serine protease
MLAEVLRPEREGMKHRLTKHWTYSVHALLGTAFLAMPLALTAAGKETDQVIVKPKPGRDLTELHARGRGQLKKQVNDAEGNLDVVKLLPGVTIAEALGHYRGHADVEYVEPDYILSANVVPNDPRYADGTLWALNNTGQSGGQNDADVDAPEAWTLRLDAQQVIVAVVDTGVRFTHEDLAANMWRNPGEVAGNGIDDDHNGYVDDVHGISALDATGYPMDGHGHGTHVAGTIAAAGNNGLGVVGVAWRAQIMALKFLDGNGDGYTSDAVASIDYARTKGAAVVNASFAGPDNSVSLREAIGRARSAGMIIVAAAGNEGVNNDSIPNYPANYALDNIISVAATTRSDALANYSNYGAQTVDLGAPGSSIYSTYHTADNAYVSMSGTSMAAPHVAGAVALLRVHVSGLTHTQLIDRLLKAVDPLPALAGKTASGGRLNLQRALQGGSVNPVNVKLAMLPGNLPDQLRIRITGSPGQICYIQQSTDLRSWTTLGYMPVPITGTIDFNIDAVANARAYYRARVM